MAKLKAALKWFFESFIWLGIILLVIDIVTKNVIVANRVNITEQGGIVLIPNFLRINYLINTHVAFGQGFDNPLANRIVFIIVALCISALIILYLVKNWKKTRKLYRAIACMVIAGALGNVIDRIFFTAEYLSCPLYPVTDPGVVDWIDFYGIWQFNFNIADCCVVIAAFMLIIVLIIDVIKEHKAEKAKQAKEVKVVEKKISKTELETRELREQDKKKDE